MKLVDFYHRAVEFGMEADPRGKSEVLDELKAEKERYNELNKKEKERFDKEKLSNPYADTRILNGSNKTEVKSIMVGVDIEIGELLLAERLRELGKGPDLVVAHHPEGRALVIFHEVMGMQAGILNKFGVPINVAESLLNERIKEVERRLMPINYNRTVDAARILGIPFMCVHTPADNNVVSYLQAIFDREKPKRVKDIIDMLSDIPEYKDAVGDGYMPRILIGDGQRRAGKVFVDMTGGTEGSKKVFERLSQAGVGTIVGMHLTEEHKKEAEKHHINVVIAGHISSDALGINLLLDKIIDKEEIEIFACSGFRRIEASERKPRPL